MIAVHIFTAARLDFARKWKQKKNPAYDSKLEVEEIHFGEINGK